MSSTRLNTTLIYSVYSFNIDDADCVGRLIHLALEVDIH